MYHPLPIPSVFELFLIKFDHFWLKSTTFWLKDWIRQLKDEKSWNQSKKMTSINFFDLFWSLLLDFELFDGILKFWNRFCCNDLDSDKELGSKKLTKRRFKSEFRPKLIQAPKLTVHHLTWFIKSPKWPYYRSTICLTTIFSIKK